MTALDPLLACPRCDKALSPAQEGYRCDACKVDFPCIDDIPWLFAEPEASLGEWRNRLALSLQRLGHDLARIDDDLGKKDLRTLTRRRLERLKSATEFHRRSLQELLAPLDVQSMRGSYESYLALRTRLPADQGLNTYYANVHRDWCWGDEENEASLEQVRAVMRDDGEPGKTLVLGSGASRLAYDLHQALEPSLTVAVDFNPLLLLIARQVLRGEQPRLYEFPIAPRSLEDTAVLRRLSAPAAVRDGFHLVLADVLRPPFATGSFDTVLTPWLIDIVSEDLPAFAGRVNALLAKGGRWINFGSLAFDHPRPARCYSAEETREIVTGAGFAEPYVAEATIPYMCSPASRHARREKVFTFSALKQRNAKAPARHRALPDWIVTGREPVPLSRSFRTQAMTTQIYAFIMSLIDGKRTLEDMAVILEKQQLMKRDEAVPAIRSFLTKMYDDSERQSGY